MKNNRQIKYLLIALVVFIWGVVIYRVVSGLAPDDEPVIPRAVRKAAATGDTATTYSLLTDTYPDPFLNDIFEEDTIEAETIENTGLAGQPEPAPPLPSEASQPPPEAVPPADIKYSGYIYNPQSKKKTAMISYNGRMMVVGVSDRIDERIKVVKITDQQLTVSINGQRREIRLGGG